MKLLRTLNNAVLNAFFFLIIAMIGIAWVFPFYGTEQSPVPLKAIANTGVALVFFLYGLRLNLADMLTAVRNWKLHLLVQSTTFILFPAVVLIALQFIPANSYPMWRLGSLYVAALPSTVSSSVVMVSIAGGNVAAAILNASLSSIIGIAVTPAWMALFTSADPGATGSSEMVVFTLLVQVLAPLALGLLLNRRLGGAARRYQHYLRYLDQATILLIVYRAFAESFYSGMFAPFDAIEIGALAAAMLALFLLMVAAMNVLSHVSGLNARDRTTLVFCGSKKSLVQGAVMGQVLFTNPAAFGVILLPLMVYHTLQLVAGSMLASRIAARQRS